MAISYLWHKYNYQKVEHFTNDNNTFTKKTLASGVKGIALEAADIDNNGDTEIIV
jgi:hypothetical protein